MTTLALFTTIYPGVEKYLADWYRSVREQTDQAFDLWIGVDAIAIDVAKEAMGADPGATWVPGAARDTPAQIRQRALTRIAQAYEGVVLVDSDDLLHASRVATAREMLERDDIVGCALRLVDEQGLETGVRFGLPLRAQPEDIFPRNNIFGLSNTAMRTGLLRRCLPIPAPVALVDWFLATRAWLMGARMAFGDEVGMDYRQHGANMARVTPPFEEDQVALDTERVRSHFRIVQSSLSEGALADRLAEVARTAADVEAFHARIVVERSMLRRYVRALNTLESVPLWWSCVANPLLRHMWAPKKEIA